MRAVWLLPVLLLAACSGGSSTGAPPGEDKALDQAAASLDANSPDSNATETVASDESGNEE